MSALISETNAFFWRDESGLTGGGLYFYTDNDKRLHDCSREIDQNFQSEKSTVKETVSDELG